MHSITQAFANQLFFFMLIFIGLTDSPWYKHPENLNTWYCICYLLRSIQLVINAVVLFCNFEMNRSLYRCLCGYCDSICHKYFLQKTIESVVDELS